jgi:hypothetical protein
LREIKPYLNQSDGKRINRVGHLMSSYPSPESWKYANTRQRNRAARTFEILRRRAVPTYSGPLFLDDDDAVNLQSAGDVAKRTMVLWAVALKAEGIPQADALELINRFDLWCGVSPSEMAFLHNKEPTPTGITTWAAVVSAAGNALMAYGGFHDNEPNKGMYLLAGLILSGVGTIFILGIHKLLIPKSAKK